MKMLIVDDNPMMRRLIGRVVSDLVNDIYECGDGDEALDAYRRLRPDWVSMEIKMSRPERPERPERMDGLAATREILAAFPEAKVVIVSQDDDEGLREAARQAGARGYVLKENLIALRDLIAKPQS